MTAAQIYTLQEQASQAESRAHSLYEQRASALRHQTPPLGMTMTEWVANDIAVSEAMNNARTLRKRLAEAQKQIGGVVFCVAQDNKRELEKRLKTLNKRAVKTKVPMTDLVWTGETVIKTYNPDPKHSGRSFDFIHEYVVIKGTAPIIPGFTIIAKLAHTAEGVIVSRVPLPWLMHGQDEALYSEIDLSRYFDAKPICEHCNKIRSRNDTFIVHNDETGEVKQIGRTCLRDYTGVDTPEKIVKHLEYVEEFFRACRNSRSTKPVILTADYLTHVCTMVRRYGYRRWDTKMGAIDNLNALRYQRKDHNGQPEWVTPSDQDRTKAQAVLTWGKALKVGDSDFLHNVHTACSAEYMESPSMGFLAYSPVAYDKAQNAANKVEGEGHNKAEVDHIAAEKARIMRPFTIKKIRWINNPYALAETPLYIMEDEYGNPAKWFASRDFKMSEGGTYLLTATVKRHEDDPKWGKSTILTRCKIDATIKEPVAA